MKIFLSACLIIGSLLPLFAENPSCNDALFTLQSSLSHIESKGVGYKRGYTTLAFLATSAAWQYKEFYPFLDLRGHGFDNRKLAANAGTGIRYSISSNSFIGGNIYYDVTQGPHQRFQQVGHNFQQIGCGLEFLNPFWDFRMNFYQPIGKKNLEVTQLFFNKNNPSNPSQVCKKVCTAQGADLEIGRILNCGYLFNQNLNWNLYGALGSYYYHPYSKKAFVGGKIRFIATFNDYYSLEIRSSYDRHTKGILQAELAMNFPLYGSKLLVTTVERSAIIPLFKRSINCKKRVEP